MAATETTRGFLPPISGRYQSPPVPKKDNPTLSELAGSTKDTKTDLSVMDRVLKAIEAERASKKAPAGEAKTAFDYYINQFKTNFRNQVGEEPSQQDVDAFLENVVLPVNGRFGGTQDFKDRTQDYISTVGLPRLQAATQRKLGEQKAEAARLSDFFMEEGRSRLGSISNDLRDYQVKLFEKLRPQLSLAAQAGGYADSGGQLLQEQGALSDLGLASQNFLAPRLADLSNQALNIKYSGESAPYEYERALALNQPDYLRGLGESSLNQLRQFALNDQNFKNQFTLQERQSTNQPGFWESFGQNALASGIQGLATGAGYALGGPAGGAIGGQVGSRVAPRRSNYYGGYGVA